ncbi:MAG: four helix bundle protein [Chloroflexi bacterium]|nr:four helix bundle protein [Chloroflexota bacterium]
MGNDKGLESLQVWQKSMGLAVKIHKQVLPLFPVEEQWALTSQLRRASQSIPANIAEGYGRYYYQEGIRFCYIARGSLQESYSHLHLAYKYGYITDEINKELSEYIQELQRMLNGYIAFLKRSKRGEGEPGSRQAFREEPEIYDIEPELEDPDDQLPD